MKRDEVKGIIEGITDEQLDAILKLNGDSVNAEKAKATALRKQLEEANERLKASDDEREKNAKAAMTLEERVKAMEDSYAAKQRELSIEMNKIEAQKILTAAGLTEEHYAPLMATIISDDKDVTEANAKAIAELVSAQRTLAEQSARSAMLKETPKPGGTSGKGSITKEQFDSMSYMDLVKLHEEDPETYKELSNS